MRKEEFSSQLLKAPTKARVGKKEHPLLLCPVLLMKGGITRKGLIAHWQNSDVSSLVNVVSTFYLLPLFDARFLLQVDNRRYVIRQNFSQLRISVRTCPTCVYSITFQEKCPVTMASSTSNDLYRKAIIFIFLSNKYIQRYTHQTYVCTNLLSKDKYHFTLGFIMCS